VNHVVAELYSMVNVPTAVWINEEGRIVRPPDSAGASDAFRKMDTATFRMPPDALADARAGRKAYVAALRDWIENGSASKYVLQENTIREKLRPYNDDDALAAAYFRLGVELYQLGRKDEAQSWMAEAKRLRPESWSFKRQAWELEAVGKSAGPEFWQAVHALGEKRYYPPIEL
jgi:tetratricopeptide (TPR) repeat protein